MSSDGDYVPQVMQCIRSIESIYPTVGRAMYGEPRDRLAYKISELIQNLITEDRKSRKENSNGQ